MFNATTSKDCFSAWNRKAPKKNQCQGEYEKWHPPPPGTLIVNIDASFNIIGDTNRSPEVQVQPISSCSESRSPASTQCAPSVQPHEDLSPLGICRHRTEAEILIDPHPGISRSPPVLYSAGDVEETCGIIASEPNAFATEDHRLESSSFLTEDQEPRLPAPLLDKRPVKDAQYSMLRASDRRERRSSASVLRKNARDSDQTPPVTPP